MYIYIHTSYEVRIWWVECLGVNWEFLKLVSCHSVTLSCSKNPSLWVNKVNINGSKWSTKTTDYVTPVKPNLFHLCYIIRICSTSLDSHYQFAQHAAEWLEPWLPVVSFTKTWPSAPKKVWTWFVCHLVYTSSISKEEDLFRKLLPPNCYIVK